MNRKLFSVLLFSFSLGIGSAKAQNFARKVNTLIGTDYTGNTYPGAQAPFGMVQLSPDNGLPGWDRIAGYFYPDSTIAGFSHTHLSGTGAGDLYDISYLPATKPFSIGEEPLGLEDRRCRRGRRLPYQRDAYGCRTMILMWNLPQHHDVAFSAILSLRMERKDMWC